MTKAFWLPGLKVVNHTRWIDQKSWCPSNRCSEWFLRPSSPALPGTGWTSWQRMPIHLPQTLSSAEIRCFSPAPEYWAFSLNIHNGTSLIRKWCKFWPGWLGGFANSVFRSRPSHGSWAGSPLLWDVRSNWTRLHQILTWPCTTNHPGVEEAVETLLDLVMARIERSLATLRYSVTDILPVYFSVDFQQKKNMYVHCTEKSRHPRAHQPKPGPGRFDSPTPGLWLNIWSKCSCLQCLISTWDIFCADAGQGTHWTICQKKVLEVAPVDSWCCWWSAKIPWNILEAKVGLYQIHKKTLIVCKFGFLTS